ncbi:MAG: hypothetical protein JWQ74_3537 [Marmoricola sp.]|nr:hypothetical protein [Marmoricola sp.]
MIVMGLDLATNSGWAVRDSAKHRSSIECGVISVGEYDWETKYGSFSVQLLALVRQHKPDFVAIERPEHGVRQFKKAGKPDLTGQAQETATINPGALQLTGIVGAAVTVCTLMNIPCGFIAANSWRPIYYGKGFRPPVKLVRDRKTGKQREDGLDWKQAAIDACDREGIKLPTNKDDQRDAAEAVAVCTCWAKTTVLGLEWMEKRFIAIRTGAYRKEAA